jgi:hypothetical protein
VHTVTKGNLAAILDKLWTCAGERRRCAATLLQSLDREDWLVLAGWDTAATFCAPDGLVKLRPPGIITVSDALGGISLVAHLVTTGKKNPERSLIRYRGVPKAVELDESSPNTPKKRFSHDPIGLLIALQQIRDRIDSMVFHPPELRSHMIDEISRYSGFSRDHVLRLTLWYPAISHIVS